MLLTERLAVRHPTMEDAEDFHAVWGDPEVIYWAPCRTSSRRARGWVSSSAGFAFVPQDIDGRFASAGDVLALEHAQQAAAAVALRVGARLPRRRELRLSRAG